MKLNYAAQVRKFAFEHPLLSAILVQVTFWVIAFLLLGLILHFNALATGSIHFIEVQLSFTPILIFCALIGLLYGILLGCSDFYLSKNWLKVKSPGLIILIKTSYYFIVMLIMFLIVKNVVWEMVLHPTYFKNIILSLPSKAWQYYYYLTLVYVLFMSVVVSFVIQISSKFGPGILIPLLLGKYSKPQEEERAFIFVDLKSSTTHAENLGHFRYSSLIRDCFLNINHISVKYGAEIYQYVGDEIVLSWPVKHVKDLSVCIDFFFACQDDFVKRKNKFIKKYNILPEFKAGLHLGVVTAVEVGDVKRELAYHGDTLNVAARIQEKCNECGADLIISEDFKKTLKSNIYHFESLELASLRGREEQMRIFKVSRV
ncbi:adenylate/guanylate cyclase domain-containing protein [Pedobacter alpinus]|uniref:Adenylate/guanylate cyclase domain-containing protein n=1 Tax=Pedobacter alpinus TaxID=1590643 RepID=A0ABW5TRC0_9SPHI